MTEEGPSLGYDIRRLTPEASVAILVECGISKTEARALNRPDRVHLIREFATLAYKAGVSHHLHKFAHSGELDMDKDMTVDSSVTDEQKLVEFRGHCAEVWENSRHSGAVIGFS